MQPPAAASCVGSTEHSSCTPMQVGSIALDQAADMLTSACTCQQVGLANMATRMILRMPRASCSRERSETPALVCRWDLPS